MRDLIHIARNAVRPTNDTLAGPWLANGHESRVPENNVSKKFDKQRIKRQLFQDALPCTTQKSGKVAHPVCFMKLQWLGLSQMCLHMMDDLDFRFVIGAYWPNAERHEKHIWYLMITWLVKCVKFPEKRPGTNSYLKRSKCSSLNKHCFCLFLHQDPNNQGEILHANWYPWDLDTPSRLVTTQNVVRRSAKIKGTTLYAEKALHASCRYEPLTAAVKKSAEIRSTLSILSRLVMVRTVARRRTEINTIPLIQHGNPVWSANFCTNKCHHTSHQISSSMHQFSA